MNEYKLETKFGTCKITNEGYYQITSRKEGNHLKYLHRLIWEDYYGKPIPKGYHINFLNGIKTDLNIQNLECSKGPFHNNGKYDLWDNSYVHYRKKNMYNEGREPNPCKCFGLRYENNDISIGGFYEWTSIDIINDLIKQEVN